MSASYEDPGRAAGATGGEGGTGPEGGGAAGAPPPPPVGEPATAPAGTPPEVPSLFKRLLDVFISPGRLFEALKERPVWAGALFLGAALLVLSMVVLPTEVYRQMAQDQLSQMGEAGAEGAPSADTMATFMRVGGAVGGLITWFVVAALSAGLMTVIFSFILGDEGRFKQYLSIASHGLLIAAVGSVLVIPLRIASGDIQSTLSVGTFFPFIDDATTVGRTLRGLDLFGLWANAAMGIGVSKLDPDRGAVGATLILWSIALVFAVIAALIGGMMGV